MDASQLKRLAEITLNNRLMLCSVQRTLRHVWESAVPQDEDTKGIVAEFEKLELILQQIEIQDDPRDRAMFGLPELELAES
jgi:hypothetical protein